MAVEQTDSHKWLVVAFLWLVGCLNYMDRQAVFSVLPIFSKEFRMSDIQLALLGSVFLWTYGGSSPVAGYFGDRFRRKKVILWSLLVFSAATLATGIALTSWQLIWLRGLLGISEALYLPAALALIADYHSGRTRSRAIGIHQTSLLAGGALGGFLGGYMGDHYGWRKAFYLLGGGGVAMAVALALFLQEIPKGATDFPTSSQRRLVPTETLARRLETILAKPTVLCIVFCGVSTSMLGWVLMTWMPLYMHERFGESLAQAGFNATFYFSVASVAGILVGSVLADRWAIHHPQGRMFVQFLGLTVAACAGLVVGFVGTVSILLASLVILGLGRGLWDCNNMPIFCDVVSPTDRSTTYGLYNLANTVSGGGSVLLTGALRKSLGIGATLSILSLMLVASAGLTLITLRWFLLNDMKSLREKIARFS